MTQADADLIAARQAVMQLIDDFWQYFRNPAEYVARTERGESETHYSVGEWPHGEPLVRRTREGVCVRLPYRGRLLPITRDGCEEIVVRNPSMSEIEELLATLRHAVEVGAADRFLTG